MNRNEALVRIKAALSEHADGVAHYVLDERKPEEAAQLATLRDDIDGILTIGEAFPIMQQEGFRIRNAVSLVINALIEDTIEDEFRAVPSRGWGDV